MIVYFVAALITVGDSEVGTDLTGGETVRYQDFQDYPFNEVEHTANSSIVIRLFPNEMGVFLSIFLPSVH